MATKTTKGISATTGQPFEVTETERTDSVEISLTAKGEATVSVKVYDEDSDVATETAVAAFRNVCAKLRSDGVKLAGDNTAA